MSEKLTIQKDSVNEKERGNLRILPADFELPTSLAIEDKDKSALNQETKSFDFQYDGRDFECKCLFEREHMRRARGTSYPLVLKVQAIEKGESEFAFKFSGTLIFGRIDDNSKPGDKVWYIIFRRVEKKSRGKGFGEIALNLYEDLVSKIQNEYPELHADAIRIDTSLSSMAALSIKKGYRAEFHSEEDVQNLLSARTSDINDSNHDFEREKIIFLKRL